MDSGALEWKSLRFGTMTVHILINILETAQNTSRGHKKQHTNQRNETQQSTLHGFVGFVCPWGSVGFCCPVGFGCSFGFVLPLGSVAPLVSVGPVTPLGSIGFRCSVDSIFP